MDTNIDELIEEYNREIYDIFIPEYANLTKDKIEVITITPISNSRLITLGTVADILNQYENDKPIKGVK